MTHQIQPLDLSLMVSIKTNYQECIRKWLQNNPGGVCDKNAFIEVFAEVHKKATTVENTVNGFCHAGIFQWDPTKVYDKKCAPSELFKKDELMPDINTSVNEARGEAEKSLDKVASDSTQAESKLPEKENEASGSGDGKNRVVTTINPEGMINEIVIDGVKYRMVPLGDGDGQPKSTEVNKNTSYNKRNKKKDQ